MVNFGEARWVQLVKSTPHLHAGAPGIFSDLLRCVQMVKRSRERESGVRKATGSYNTYSSLVKLQPWLLSLRWKVCLWAELQSWFLSLQWKTCPWAEHTDDDIPTVCNIDDTISNLLLWANKLRLNWTIIRHRIIFFQVSSLPSLPYLQTPITTQRVPWPMWDSPRVAGNDCCQEK